MEKKNWDKGQSEKFKPTNINAHPAPGINMITQPDTSLTGTLRYEISKNKKSREFGANDKTPDRVEQNHCSTAYVGNMYCMYIYV